MKIESAAGEFEFAIEAMKVQDDNIVLTGKMGVWEAETEISRGELISLIRLAFASRGLWPFLLRLPIQALFGPRSAKNGGSNDA